jgi:hypothetical protein
MNQETGIRRLETDFDFVPDLQHLFPAKKRVRPVTGVLYQQRQRSARVRLVIDFEICFMPSFQPLFQP